MSAKDGGAKYPVCKNCGLGPNDHTWVTRRCANGVTYEDYDEEADAMLSEDAEKEGE